MLKVRMVSKQLQDHPVLDQLDMEVNDGCIYGLIGPNGAGKSTLLRVMAGVYQPDMGCVTIDDVAIHNDPSRLKDILLISDDPYYFRKASLLDMKQFYRISHPDFQEEYYQKLIRLMKLNDHIPLDRYSKGMKRQAFLILGLCCAPRYLLLDEAFDGLDPHMRMIFKKEIVERLEEKQMSVVISSHSLREMEEICDCFGILENGKLITSGSMGEWLDTLHQYQLAFKEEASADMFSHLPVLSCKVDSRVVTLILEGDSEILETELAKLQPVLMERLDVRLEELFVYALQERNDKV